MLLVGGFQLIYYLSTVLLELFEISDRTVQVFLNCFVTLFASQKRSFIGTVIADHSSPSINILNGIVVDSKLREQYFVFISRICIFQFVFHISVLEPFLHHAPESGIVKVINMTVYLPPFEVILQDLQIWIEDDPGIK